MVDTVLSALVFIACLTGMEGVAWATHRFIMHGPLWVLHRSHHRPHRAGFEANDLFALFFAAIAIALFWTGAHYGWSLATWAGAGVTTYGALYALAHDGLVHRRWPVPFNARSGYLRRLVQAHRLHHICRTKANAVSFGFLYPGDVRQLAAQLRRERQNGAAAEPAPQTASGRRSACSDVSSRYETTMAAVRERVGSRSGS